MPTVKRARPNSTTTNAAAGNSAVATTNSPSAASFKQIAGDVEQAIRDRAYELYAERGFQEGMEQEDWFRAEAEILGRYRRTA